MHKQHFYFECFSSLDQNNILLECRDSQREEIKTDGFGDHSSLSL